MTPALKAKELFDKMYNQQTTGVLSKNVQAFKQAKQCALIAVKFAKENPLNTDGYNEYLDKIEKEIQSL